MSLIKSVDVPKHRADRLLSRRIAARLSGSAAQQLTPPATKPAPPITPDETPTTGLLGPAIL